MAGGRLSPFLDGYLSTKHFCEVLGFIRSNPKFAAVIELNLHSTEPRDVPKTSFAPKRIVTSEDCPASALAAASIQRRVTARSISRADVGRQ